MTRQYLDSPRHYSYIRIVLPAIVTFLMFFTSLYAFILPHYKQSLQERKLETVHEVTHIAWSILDHYRQQELSGVLSPEEARQKAIGELRNFRYGPDMKDYVWIHDMKPDMIMHPYRPDLENQSLADFTDSLGKRLFVEMVEVVNEQSEGVVEYYWQWKDDPSRTAQKISFVKVFEPWGWVIGSGIYTDDVAAEIALMTRQISIISSVILATVLILLIIMILQSIRIERSRMQSVQDLRLSERKFRDLTEMLPIVVYEMDQEKNMTFLNRHAYDMLGYSRSDSFPDNLLTAIHPDDYNRAIQNIDMLLSGENVGLNEYRMLKKDGSVITVFVRSYPIIQAGRVKGIRGIIMDITDKIRAEQELRASEEKYRELVENANSIILRFDRNGRITFINEYAEDFFGYTGEEIIGKDAVGTILPEIDSNGRDLREMMSEICRFPDNYYNNENENIRKNGERVWIHWANKAILDDKGNIREILGIGNDITERRMAETALHQSEARMRSILRASPIGMGVVSKRIIQFVNEQVCIMSGYSFEELEGKSTRMLYPSEEDYQYVGEEKYSQIRKYGTGSVETRWKCKDGQILNVLLSSSQIDPLKINDDVTFTVMDITERKKLEKQFLQAQKMETVGRLAGGIAHDFNNMLTVITGNAELALLGLPDDSQEQEFINEVLRTSEHAAKLTRQLLAFSRQQVIEQQVVNLNDILTNMDMMLRRIVGEHIEFKTVVEEDLWTVKVDPGQIEQVLTNLVVNSHDAMPDGGNLTIETANTVLDERYAHEHVNVKPGEYVMFAVTDTGIGMDEAVISHVFEPFYTTKEKGKGTGLGMSTCYGIVTQNDGTIWIYSEPDIGTTIKVFLPRAKEEAGPGEDKKEDVDLPKGSGRILVAEDEKNVRKMVERVLVSNGYTVIVAESGDEALDLARREAPGSIQLLLTDVVMPKMNGSELAKSILTFHPNIKVLYMSGYTDDSMMNFNMLDEGVSLLQKPFTHRQLLKRIHRLLDA